MITREKFDEIFERTSINATLSGDTAFKGLQILSNYTNHLIQAAEHDMIFSISVDELIELEITEEDVIKLARLNWLISEYDNLFSFV